LKTIVFGSSWGATAAGIADVWAGFFRVESTSSLVTSPGLTGQTTLLPTVVSSVVASVRGRCDGVADCVLVPKRISRA
jgi:hypothetical protein